MKFLFQLFSFLIYTTTLYASVVPKKGVEAPVALHDASLSRVQQQSQAGSLAEQAVQPVVKSGPVESESSKQAKSVISEKKLSEEQSVSKNIKLLQKKAITSAVLGKQNLSAKQEKRMKPQQAAQSGGLSLPRVAKTIGKQVEPQKTVAKKVAPAVRAPVGISFRGIQEEGVNKNTFLCPVEASGSSCSQETINDAVGFDISGGKNLQFFDNFVYWLLQKAHREQFVKEDLRYDGVALTKKMNQEGWGATNAYCIIISTNPMLQQLVMPGQSVAKGKQKVIVQLWYSGQDVIQLWSQDVVELSPGQGFKVIVSNNEDDKLEALIDESKKAVGLAVFLEKLGLQANNRKDAEYAQATGSPRMVRIEVVDISFQMKDDSLYKESKTDKKVAGDIKFAGQVAGGAIDVLQHM